MKPFITIELKFEKIILHLIRTIYGDDGNIVEQIHETINVVENTQEEVFSFIKKYSF